MKKEELLMCLVNKMMEEFESFKKKCVEQTSEDIVRGFIPYELVYKQDLLSCFDDDSLTERLSDADVSFLYSREKPLDWLYTQWLDSDGSHMDMLRDVIMESLRNAGKE